VAVAAHFVGIYFMSLNPFDRYSCLGRQRISDMVGARFADKWSDLRSDWASLLATVQEHKGINL
jgi:hypothetical protein